MLAIVPQRTKQRPFATTFAALVCLYLVSLPIPRGKPSRIIVGVS